MPAKTFVELIASSGSSLEKLAGAIDVDIDLLYRIRDGRQPLPPQIETSLALALAVDRPTLRSSVPMTTKLVRSEMLQPLSPERARGDVLSFGAVAPAAPTPIGGTPVLPIVSSNLKLWLRGDMMAATANIADWTDLSSSGHNAAQAAGALQPLRIASHAPLGSKQVASFESGDYMDVVGTEPAGSWTAFAVLDLSTTEGTTTVFGDALAFWVRNRMLGWFDGVVHEVAPISIGAQIFAWVMDASSLVGTIYRNDVNIGSAAYISTSPLAGAATLVSGHAGATQILGELLLYNKAFSASELSSVFVYLLRRYGLS